MAIPIVFVIFQLNTKMDKNTRQSIMKRMATEQTIPSAETETSFPFIKVNKSHGSGNLKKYRMLEYPIFCKVYQYDSANSPIH